MRSGARDGAFQGGGWKVILGLAVALCAWALAGTASARADGPAQGPATSSKSGALVVSIGGLPRGSHPAATIRGPGLVRRLSSTKTVLHGLRPGVYRLRLQRGTVTRSQDEVRKGATLLPSLTAGKAQARVPAGGRVAISARYGSIVNPGVRSVAAGTLISVEGPAENPRAVILAGAGAIGVGSVVSMPPSAALPRGLLAGATSVQSRGGRTRVGLQPVSPFEVVPVAEFWVPLTEAATARAAVAGCGGASGIDPYRNIKDVSFEGSWNTTRILGQDIKTGVRAKILFTVEAGVNVSAGVGISCKVSRSFSVSGMAGPVPVTAGLEGDLSGFAGVGARLTTKGSARVGLGVATVGTGAYPTVEVGSPSFSAAIGSFAEVRAGLGLGMKLGIGNDNLASVTAKFGGGLDFSARPGSCSWDANFGQFSAQGKVWKFGIESPKTPALLSKNLWQGCGGSGSPGSGSSPRGSGPPKGPGATGFDRVTPLGPTSGPSGFGLQVGMPPCREGLLVDDGNSPYHAAWGGVPLTLMRVDIGFLGVGEGGFPSVGSHQISFSCEDYAGDVVEWTDPGFAVEVTAPPIPLALQSGTIPAGGELVFTSGASAGSSPCPSFGGFALSNLGLMLMSNMGDPLSYRVLAMPDGHTSESLAVPPSTPPGEYIARQECTYFDSGGLPNRTAYFSFVPEPVTVF